MSEAANDLSGAKRRIIERLKRADTSTAPELAAEFGLDRCVQVGIGVGKGGGEEARRRHGIS
ncbi:MAG: hypothetical protein ABMA25_28825, partial [Ilumatobacteraceae bacterium]